MIVWLKFGVVRVERLSVRREVSDYVEPGSFSVVFSVMPTGALACTSKGEQTGEERVHECM